MSSFYCISPLVQDMYVKFCYTDLFQWNTKSLPTVLSRIVYPPYTATYCPAFDWGGVNFLSPLFPALFSYFIHHLSTTPYCLLTASVSFEPCELLSSQKEVREPYKYTELWPCVRWRRHCIHYYKVILTQSVIQYLRFQCQEQTSNMKNTKELFRNGNSDGWKALLTPPTPKWLQKTPHFFFFLILT